jgi:hypothetical protein
MKALLIAALMAASITPSFAQGTAKPARSVAPPAKAAPAAPTNAAPAPTAIGFVGNKGSKICHKAECKSVGKMKDANKVSFASAADAQKAGFKACKSCKPF